MRTMLFLFCSLVLTIGSTLFLGGCGNNYRMQGDSMAPTLEGGTAFTVDPDAYLNESPQRGDVVVFEGPKSQISRISRIVGLPGELVQIRDGLVYVESVRLDEPYIMPNTRTGPEADYRVPNGNVFLLSDNRDTVQDSRGLGFIPMESVRGRLVPEPVSISAWSLGVPLPSQVIFDKVAAYINFVLALIMVMVVYLGATLFNNTLKENYGVISGWYAHSANRLKEFWRKSAGGRHRPKPRYTLEGVTAVLVVALLYSFLDPSFGLNTSGLVLFLSLAIGVAVVTLGYEGVQVLVSSHLYKVPSAIKIFPFAVLIAVIFVVLSRSIDFRPGLIYGFVGAYAYISAKKLSGQQDGRVILIGSVSLLVISAIAFMARQPLANSHEDNYWAKLSAEVMDTIVIGGLEGLLFLLVPMDFSDGAKLARWKGWVWALLFLLVAFAFFFLIINDGGRITNVVSNVKANIMFGIMLAFLTISVATWAYFRFRRQPQGLAQ